MIIDCPNGEPGSIPLPKGMVSTAVRSFGTDEVVFLSDEVVPDDDDDDRGEVDVEGVDLVETEAEEEDDDSDVEFDNTADDAATEGQVVADDDNKVSA